MKVNTKRMILKMSGKFNWRVFENEVWWVDLLHPRNVRYIISKYPGQKFYYANLKRLQDRHGVDIHIGKYTTLEEAQDRVELREARYEVRKATMEGKC